MSRYRRKDLSDSEIRERLQKGAKVNGRVRNTDGKTFLMMVRSGKLARELIAAGADVNAKTNYGSTPLYFACSHGHFTVVQALLKAGAKIDSSDALETAAEHGHLDIVKALLAAGADVNAKSKCSVRTALLQAAWNDQLEVVKTLIAAGADVNAQSEAYDGGFTPLYAACDAGSPELVRLLIAAGADVNKTTASLVTPLMSLFIPGPFFNPDADGWNAVVRMLLNAGANINAQNEDGWTALMFACECRYCPPCVIRTLIEAGADVNIKDKYGWTAWLRAIENAHVNAENNVEIISLLTEAGADTHVDVNVPNEYGKTPLISVSRWGNPDSIKILLDAGADVNARETADYRDGKTALMEASSGGHSEAVRLLLDAGADIHAKDKHGRTALMFACEHDNLEVSRELIRRGADVNAKDNYGWTVWLHLAAHSSKHFAEILDVLTQAGADFHADVDVNVGNEYGNTPLMDACRWGCLKAIKMLLNSGADVNLKDEEAETALMKACQRGNLEVVSLLLSAGAQINAQDKFSGKTPLMYAALSNHLDVVQALVEAGADVNTKNKNGYTALEMIRDYNDVGNDLRDFLKKCRDGKMPKKAKTKRLNKIEEALKAYSSDDAEKFSQLLETMSDAECAALENKLRDDEKNPMSKTREEVAESIEQGMDDIKYGRVYRWEGIDKSLEVMEQMDEMLRARICSRSAISAGNAVKANGGKASS